MVAFGDFPSATFIMIFRFRLRQKLHRIRVLPMRNDIEFELWSLQMWRLDFCQTNTQTGRTYITAISPESLSNVATEIPIVASISVRSAVMSNEIYSLVKNLLIGLLLMQELYERYLHVVVD